MANPTEKVKEVAGRRVVGDPLDPQATLWLMIGTANRARDRALAAANRAEAASEKALDSNADVSTKTRALQTAQEAKQDAQVALKRIQAAVGVGKEAARSIYLVRYGREYGDSNFLAAKNQTEALQPLSEAELKGLQAVADINGYIGAIRAKVEDAMPGYHRRLRQEIHGVDERVEALRRNVQRFQPAPPPPPPPPPVAAPKTPEKK